MSFSLSSFNSLFYLIHIILNSKILLLLFISISTFLNSINLYSIIFSLSFLNSITLLLFFETIFFETILHGALLYLLNQCLSTRPIKCKIFHRCGESPLLTAVNRDDHSIIQLLMQCGAHLAAADTKHVAELLSLAARRGSVSKLESLRIAGADLNLTDELGQNALHKVSLYELKLSG